MRDTGIRVDRAHGDVGATEARRRYGGLDLPATLAGTVAALGTTVLVGGLVAGAGTVGYQLGLEGKEELSVGGLVGGLVTLVFGFLVGGWVAGRMARYDGGRNGIMTAVWFLLLAAATAALGAWVGKSYNAFERLQLPQWFSANARSAAAVATGVLALAVMVFASWVGGRAGSRYHRRPDALIAQTRQGGISPPNTATRIP